MISRHRAAFLFLLVLFLSTPLTFSQHKFQVVLGDYYYPKGKKQWEDRKGKTVFEPGDSIIIHDTRVTFVRANQIPSPTAPGIIYFLSDLTAEIGRITANVDDLCIWKIAGNSLYGGQEQGWAVGVYIDPQIPFNAGSISATFTYWGGSTESPVLLDTVRVDGIATFRKPDNPTHPSLSVSSDADTVLANGTFTLSANLDADLFTFSQTTSGVTGKAIGPSTSTSKSVSFKAPAVAGNGQQGLITFNIQATFSDGVKSNVATKDIIVTKNSVPGGSGSASGTPVGTAQPGNKPPVARGVPATISVAVNTPFSVTAFASDPDGFPCPPDIGGCIGASPGVLNGKWEKAGASAPLKSEMLSPSIVGEEKQFQYQINEAVKGNYNYSFTVTDASGAGNRYAFVVNVTPKPGPTINFATTPPSTAEEGTTVDLDASTTTGQGTIQFTWSVKLEDSGTPITGSEPSKGKLRFAVPNGTAGKTVVVSLTAKDDNGPSDPTTLRIAVTPAKGPTVSLRTSANKFEVGDQVTIEATIANAKLPLSLRTWTIEYNQKQITASSSSDQKITFKIPMAAGGNTITVTFAIKDADGKQASQVFSISVPLPSIKGLTLPQIRRIVTRSPKTDSEITSLYGISAPEFTSTLAILDPSDELGNVDEITISSATAEGKPVSDYYKSIPLGIGIGVGAVPFARSFPELIPLDAQNESASIRIRSRSRLAGIGMLLSTQDGAAAGMDAFDLSLAAAKAWILPYFFGARERYGIVAIINDSDTNTAKVQSNYMSMAARPQSGDDFVLKPGASKTIELFDYFKLSALKDPTGYPTFTSDNDIRIVGFYGDNKELFAVNGARGDIGDLSKAGGIQTDDFASVVFAPFAANGAIKPNDWETVISIFNGQNQRATLDVELLNASSEKRKYSWQLDPGLNEKTLGDMFDHVLVSPTALSLSGTGSFAGSLLLKDKVTGAETMWPLRPVQQAKLDKLIYPFVAQGVSWQSSYAVLNAGTAKVELKSRAVLKVRTRSSDVQIKEVSGTFNIDAGQLLAGGLATFGIDNSKIASEDFTIEGGYLVIESVNATAPASLIGTGLLFHQNEKSVIDGLSLLPAIK